MVTKKQIDRINELARKAKKDGLSDVEKKEQQKLRRLYIDSFKASLIGTLDNTVVVNPDGTRQKVSEMKKKD